MYLNHYQLKLMSFEIGPDPKFLWLGSKHSEAFAILRYELGYFAKGGIQRRKGIERRLKNERRDQCGRTNKWSSICETSKSAVE
jgi:hypothetical protein